ncbi:MAG: tRNA (uridine(54)-C5)-methyltransferase TrmA [Arenicella sp.]
MVIDTSNANYQAQLEQKIKSLHTKFNDLSISIPDFSVFESPKKHYRMRAEFRVWHDGEDTNYAMHHPKTKEIYTLTDFPIASKAICKRMTPLMEIINSDKELRHRLFQVEFLSTTTGEVLISMIYHRALGEEWQTKATALEKSINAHIIGRSRKQKQVISKDYVIEEMTINGFTYRYQQTENSFTQPNAHVCQQMLQWACDQASDINTENSQDLLELYCGNGNFTLPLSRHYQKVLATEVSKSSVRSAQYNIDINKIDNVSIMRLSSEETVQALNKERTFRRLEEIDIDGYNFSTVFVDPPRAGLDPTTLELAKRFDNILYISCNPDTFFENLKTLTDYSIKKFAVFDQFPYTNHLEVGAVLIKQA